MIIASVVMIYPLLWMVVSSLRPNDEIFRNPSLWPLSYQRARRGARRGDSGDRGSCVGRVLGAPTQNFVKRSVRRRSISPQPSASSSKGAVGVPEDGEPSM